MNRQAIFWQQGFSLVELMVGMVLGLFLALGIGQVFVSNNNTFRTQEGMAKIQEGGRFAMQRISTAVRSAGFFGCAGMTGKAAIKPYVIASNAPTGLASITTDTPIFGTDNASSMTIDSKAVVDGSDTLTLRGSGMSGIAYTGVDIVPSADVPLASGNDSFQEEDLVLITDCATADLFRATDATSVAVMHNTTCITSGSTCNKSASLSKLYGGDAVVVHPYINTYFVAASGRTNYQGNPVMSLFLLDASGTAVELIEGVSDMQVLYGVDTNGDKVAERYMRADEITTANNWDQVVTVRISLLLDSIDDAVNTPATYTDLKGISQNPTDRLLRKEFTGLFTLRNRVL